MKYEASQENPNLTDYDFLELEKRIFAGATYSILAALDKFKRVKGDIEIMAIDWIIDGI